MMSLLGTRIAAALIVLLGLVILQLAIPEILPVIVAIALIVLPIVQWAAVGFFAARSIEDPTIISLRTRVQDAMALALAQTVGAFLGALVVLRALNIINPVDRSVFLVGIAFCLLMIAAPAVNWLWTWKPWTRA